MVLIMLKIGDELSENIMPIIKKSGASQMNGIFFDWLLRHHDVTYKVWIILYDVIIANKCWKKSSDDRHLLQLAVVLQLYCNCIAAVLQLYFSCIALQLEIQ